MVSRQVSLHPQERERALLDAICDVVRRKEHGRVTRVDRELRSLPPVPFSRR